nr:uncharacterized protein LOC113749583 [Ipomoea batatas]
MALTNFILTVAGVSAVILLMRSDVKQSATIFRRNVRQIRHWLEQESASAAKSLRSDMTTRMDSIDGTLAKMSELLFSLHGKHSVDSSVSPVALSGGSSSDTTNSTPVPSVPLQHGNGECKTEGVTKERPPQGGQALGLAIEF